MEFITLEGIFSLALCNTPACAMGLLAYVPASKSEHPSVMLGRLGGELGYSVLCYQDSIN